MINYLLSDEGIKAELENKSPEGFHWGAVTQSELQRIRIILAKAEPLIRADEQIKQNKECESCADGFISTHESATNAIREKVLKEVGEQLIKWLANMEEIIKSLKSGKML